MPRTSLQPASALLGALFATTVLLGMGQKASADEPLEYEYEIHIDIDGKEVAALTKKGWEFVGYLGQSKLGAGSDETLWRRPD